MKHNNADLNTAPDAQNNSAASSSNNKKALLARLFDAKTETSQTNNEQSAHASASTTTQAPQGAAQEKIHGQTSSAPRPMFGAGTGSAHASNTNPIATKKPNVLIKMLSVVVVFGAVYFGYSQVYGGDPAGRNTNQAQIQKQQRNNTVAAQPKSAALAANAQPASTNALSTANQVILEASGFLEARNLATVSSDITGRLEKIHVAEGDYVEKGQLIAELDDRIAQAQLLASQQNLQVVLNNQRVAEVQLRESRYKLSRLEELLKDNFASKNDYELAKYNLQILEAQFQGLVKEVEVAKRNIKVEQERLNSARIYAPFSGTVSRVDANIGEIVSPMSAGGGFTRTGICTLVDLQSIEGVVNINERDLGKIHVGQPIRISMQSNSDNEINGKVIAINPMVDRSLGAISVRLGVEPKTDVMLIPGMRLDVEFISDQTSG